MEQPSTNTISKISVVIASKVGFPFIDQCLESLEDQATELESEVLVIVPDEEPYASRIATKFSWVKVIRSKKTKVPAMRRRGVEEAAGELVAVIEEHCSAKED